MYEQSSLTIKVPHSPASVKCSHRVLVVAGVVEVVSEVTAVDVVVVDVVVSVSGLVLVAVVV